MPNTSTTLARHLVGLASAAEYAEVHPRTLRRYIASGRLTGYRVGPRLVRVDLNEVNALLRPIPAASNGPPGVAGRTPTAPPGAVEIREATQYGWSP